MKAPLGNPLTPQRLCPRLASERVFSSRSVSPPSRSLPRLLALAHSFCGPLPRSCLCLPSRPAFPQPSEKCESLRGCTRASFAYTCAYGFVCARESSFNCIKPRASLAYMYTSAYGCLLGRLSALSMYWHSDMWSPVCAQQSFVYALRGTSESYLYARGFIESWLWVRLSSRRTCI